MSKITPSPIAANENPNSQMAVVPQMPTFEPVAALILLKQKSHCVYVSLIARGG